jgi:predicted MFS family arabinose efflux permease
MCAVSPRASTGSSANCATDAHVPTSIRASADRATRLTLLQLGMWGYFLYAFGPSVPFLRDDFGISSAMAGLHSTAMSIGAIIAGTIGVRFITMHGRGRMRWFGVAALAAGALMYATAGSLWVSMAAVLLAGTGGSIIVNTTNVALLHHHEGRRGPMWASYAHAFAATIGTIAPILIGIAVAIGLGWRPAFLIVPLGALLVGLLMRGAVMRGDSAQEAKEYATREHATLPRTFWWVLAALLTGTAAEFCLTLWSTDLVRQHHGLGDAAAAWAFSGMLAGLTLVRWVSGPLSLRIGTARIIGGGLMVMIFGLVLLLAFPTPLMAVVSLVIIGLGLGPQYPFVVALALAAAGSAADRASSVASIGIGITVALAPFGLGAAADALGVVTAFIGIPMMVLASFACLTVARIAQHR